MTRSLNDLCSMLYVCGYPHEWKSHFDSNFNESIMKVFSKDRMIENGSTEPIYLKERIIT